MEIVWWPGVAHGEVKTSVASKHVLRVRDGSGSGTDAVGSDRPKQVQWFSGSLEYFPPGADHTHSTSIASDWVTIEIEISEWDELVDITGISLFAPVPCGAGKILPKAGAALRNLRRRNTIHSSNGGNALTLATLMMRTLGLSSGKRRSVGLTGTALRAVREYVEFNLSEVILVEQMARVAGLSRFYFISSFEQATGQTPHQYVLGRRLARARELLHHSGASISSVAAECGFSSHALCADSLLNGTAAHQANFVPGHMNSFATGVGKFPRQTSTQVASRLLSSLSPPRCLSLPTLVGLHAAVFRQSGRPVRGV